MFFKPIPFALQFSEYANVFEQFLGFFYLLMVIFVERYYSIGVGWKGHS